MMLNVKILTLVLLAAIGSHGALTSPDEQIIAKPSHAIQQSTSAVAASSSNPFLIPSETNHMRERYGTSAGHFLDSSLSHPFPWIYHNNKNNNNKQIITSSSSLPYEDKSSPRRASLDDPRDVPNPNDEDENEERRELAKLFGSSASALARTMMMKNPPASMSRKKRRLRNRRYDVPQIECPRARDHMERFACPSQDFRGRYKCIEDRDLCDGFFDCPGKEDEDPESCLFYKTTKAHLDILAEALLRWGRFG